MKKYPLLAIALMTLTACKRNSPQTKCLFDHQIDGITVSNEISEKRFSIELHDKSYFEFFDLNVGGYHAKIENNDISFSDSEGETIVFENNSYYFATRVNKRSLSSFAVEVFDPQPPRVAVARIQISANANAKNFFIWFLLSEIYVQYCLCRRRFFFFLLC